MIQRALNPPIWVLSIIIAVVGVIALAGIAAGVWALRSTADQAARAEARQVSDQTRADAVKESQCRILDLNRLHPGDPRPTTSRGLDLAKKYEAEYRRLGCK